MARAMKNTWQNCADIVRLLINQETAGQLPNGANE